MLIEDQAITVQQLSDIAAFAEIAHLPGSVLLESSLNAYGRGKHSFILHSPIARWEIGPNERIPQDWAKKLTEFTADRSRFHLLFLSYEFGAEILTGESNSTCSGQQAKLLALSYNSVNQIVNPADRHNGETTDRNDRDFNPATITNAPNRERYLSDVARVKEHIREGDIYQANYTGQWELQSKRNPWSVYSRLRNFNPSQYAAYANLGDRTIISSSPERLFTVTGDTIQANPIKGTIATGNSISETEQNKRSLLSSEKDKAELLMIVDLLRNDLGRICRAGEVKTKSIWNAEEYSSLIHLVGDIRGKLRSNVTLADMIQALFPGGSITGAPKKRAVELLRQIESRPRGIYTISTSAFAQSPIKTTPTQCKPEAELSPTVTPKANTRKRD
jgi:anthranilate/para-aminobenzoate synthase component I